MAGIISAAGNQLKSGFHNRLTPRAFFLRRRLLGATVLAPASALAQSGAPSPARRTLRVGKTGDVATLREASSLARDGDVVEVDAGVYAADVAVWQQSDLTLRGVGGIARLIADGAHAEGKGIFVVRSSSTRIENFSFVGTRVPDRNGAGIRLERGRLAIVNCHFEDNENGILTGNDANCELSIVGSTFLRNGTDDGQAHTLYVGAIRRLDVRGCYLANGRVGHLLKSRARETAVRTSRLTGEGGTASYELEFPNGGRAVVAGNLIQQGPDSQNYTIVSFGAEGYRWPDNRLTLEFNTLINDRPQGGVFLFAQPGNATIDARFNIVVGEGKYDVRCPITRTGDVKGTRADFAKPAGFDYRLKPRSKLVGAAGVASQIPAEVDLPTEEYRHAAGTLRLAPRSGLTPISPGAFQTIAGG